MMNCRGFEFLGIHLFILWYKEYISYYEFVVVCLTASFITIYFLCSMIYLDNNATTKIDPRVLETMMPYLTESFANASSIHSFGLQAHEAVKTARQQIANLIHCESNEIVFTSGATEAINIALKGTAEAYRKKGQHIVTVCTEHKAVLDTSAYLQRIGYEVTYLPVQKSGLIDLEQLKEAIRDDTILVSVMFANNETGVIQPIQEIADIVHSAESLFMTDGTQAIGKIPVHVDNLGIDIMAFSSHKLYGPKGVGSLFVRGRRPRRVKVEPLLHGGGQEKNMRSGTLNVPGIVGLGKACEIAQQEMYDNNQHIRALRDKLEADLLMIKDTFLNGHQGQRMYNVTNICFRNADSEAVMLGLKDIAISNGSACTSTSIEPSHVLTSMGLNNQEAYSSLRFSLGKFTVESDINLTIQQIRNVVNTVRQLVL